MNYNNDNIEAWVRSQAKLIKPGSLVLDAGCGVPKYREAFGHCDHLLQDFGDFPGLDFKCYITEIPVEKNYFDVVLCTDVLEHLPDPTEAIREFYRILRPNGILLMTAPHSSSLHQEPYHFYSGFTPYWYQYFLARQGFSIEILERNMGFVATLGEHSRYFHHLMDPRIKGWLWGLPWLLSWPILRWLIPIFTQWLDPVIGDYSTTAGYFVRARKI